MVVPPEDGANSTVTFLDTNTVIICVILMCFLLGDKDPI
jgi:hypothetical protein